MSYYNRSYYPRRRTYTDRAGRRIRNPAAYFAAVKRNKYGGRAAGYRSYAPRRPTYGGARAPYTGYRSAYRGRSYGGYSRRAAAWGVRVPTAF